MKREDLEKLAEKYQAKAERAFMNYQQTGTARYDREYRNNDDLASALRMAARAADDSHRLADLRVTLSDLGSKARALKRSALSSADPKTVTFLNEVIAAAKVRDLIGEE